jgi:uncharacterized protein (TIGR03067 family)
MRHVLACIVIGLLLGADAPRDDVKKDKEKLQGTWKAVTAEAGGKSQDDAEEHRLIFSGDEFSVKKGEETMIKGNFKIDSSKKPKEIDMEFMEAKRDNLKGKIALGIYELDGDTLKWCWNKPGGERPKKFSSEAADVHLLVTLKREKPKLSGTWGKKDGQLKIEFADKGVMMIAPHGDSACVVLCNYTVEKEGLVEVKVTGFEGNEETKKKLQERVPVGLKFTFKWKVNGDAARLDDLMGDDHVEMMKSHLEGDFEQRK